MAVGRTKTHVDGEPSSPSSLSLSCCIPQHFLNDRIDTIMSAPTAEQWKKAAKLVDTFYNRPDAGR
jgi:hypothetical protein